MLAEGSMQRRRPGERTPLSLLLLQQVQIAAFGGYECRQQKASGRRSK